MALIMTLPIGFCPRHAEQPASAGELPETPYPCARDTVAKIELTLLAESTMPGWWPIRLRRDRSGR